MTDYTDDELECMTHDDDFSWVKVKRYDEDPHEDIHSAFDRLDTHHVEETKFLIGVVRKLAGQLQYTKHELRELRRDEQRLWTKIEFEQRGHK